MLSCVFRFKLPEISSSLVLKDLARSFEIAKPVSWIAPPVWDLDKVLFALRSAPFEPLEAASLRDLTKKTLFLVSLATAKCVGELQTISQGRQVWRGPAALLFTRIHGYDRVCLESPP